MDVRAAVVGIWTNDGGGGSYTLRVGTRIRRQSYDHSLAALCRASTGNIRVSTDGGVLRSLRWFPAL